jgi:hypothetical protein
MITEGKVKEADLVDTINELRGMKLAVNLKLQQFDFNKPAKYIEKVPPRALALILMKNSGDNDMTQVDKLRLMNELRKLHMDEHDIKKLIESSGWTEVAVVDRKSEVSIYIRDGCSGQDGILFEISDSDNKDFPLLKKLEDAYGKEVYTIDGGHDEGEGGYQEYAAKQTEEK